MRSAPSASVRPLETEAPSAAHGDLSDRQLKCWKPSLGVDQAATGAVDSAVYDAPHREGWWPKAGEEWPPYAQRMPMQADFLWRERPGLRRGTSHIGGGGQAA